DYQRALSWYFIQEKAKSYRNDLVGALTLSYRPCESGRIWIVDGNHRLHIMSEMGIKTANAFVYFGKSYTEEADMFYELNNSIRKMTGWTKFRAAYKSNSRVHV